MKHNDYYCPKYKDTVLPDENGECSLCGAILVSTPPMKRFLFYWDDGIIYEYYAPSEHELLEHIEAVGLDSQTVTID